MTFDFLRRWLTRMVKQRPDLHIVVYTRAACPLCDEAWETLRQFQERYQFAMESKDVDESADLVKEYGNCVPVVVINGKLRFRGRVNPVLLRRILEA